MSQVGVQSKKVSDRSARSVVLYVHSQNGAPPVIVTVSLLSMLTSNYSRKISSALNRRRPNCVQKCAKMANL